jgi:hypothetical protein
MPSWANNPAPFFKTFFRKSKNFKSKQTGLFITCGRAINNNLKTIRRFKDEMKSLGLNQIKAELILKTRRSKIVNGHEKIDSFIDSFTRPI